jgi:hypothetical protein
MRRSIPLMAASLLLASCTEDSPGGPCEYAGYPGTATIVSVTPDISAGRPCSSSVNIVYDFTPDDPDARDRYLFPARPDTGRIFRVGTSVLDDSPPLQWTEREGLTAGSEHPCIRLEIVKGTCNPVVFEFTGLDDSDIYDYCD